MLSLSSRVPEPPATVCAVLRYNDEQQCLCLNIYRLLLRTNHLSFPLVPCPSVSLYAAERERERERETTACIMKASTLYPVKPQKSVLMLPQTLLPLLPMQPFQKQYQQQLLNVSVFVVLLMKKVTHTRRLQSSHERSLRCQRGKRSLLLQRREGERERERENEMREEREQINSVRTRGERERKEEKSWTGYEDWCRYQRLPVQCRRSAELSQHHARQRRRRRRQLHDSKRREVEMRNSSHCSRLTSNLQTLDSVVVAVVERKEAVAAAAQEGGSILPPTHDSLSSSRCPVLAFCCDFYCCCCYWYTPVSVCL